MTEPKTPRKAATPPWISYISTILDGDMDELFSPKNNDKTFSIILGALNALISNGSMSPDQEKTLINTIRKRVPGKQEFEWTGRVLLTRKMRCDAKKNPKIKHLLTYLKQHKTKADYVKHLMDQMVFEANGNIVALEIIQEVMGKLRSELPGLLEDRMAQQENEQMEEEERQQRIANRSIEDFSGNSEADKAVRVLMGKRG